MRLDSLDSLPGLLPGMYRGIEFHVFDTSSESGRRVLEYLFPGVDPAAYDDFGVMPNVVTIEALIIGDDFIARSKALQMAFETPGPATLIHPWLGPMTVMMEEPAQIRFSARELRIARISAVFKRIMPAVGSSLLGLSGLASAIAAVVAAAMSLTSAVGQRVISTAGGAAVSRSTRIIPSAVSAIRAPNGSGRFVADLGTAVLASAPATADEFADWIASAAGSMATVALQPAVAPAAEAITPATPSPRSIMAIGLQLANALGSQAAIAPAAPDRALLAVAAAQFLAQSATQSSYADYPSRREALTYRADASAAIATLVDALSPLGGSILQGEATDLERALRNLQAAIVADIHEVIGRLPDVLTFRPERQLDAWQLAQHVAGDTPSRMEAVYRDIVTRNDARHPSSLPAGALEVLDIR